MSKTLLLAINNCRDEYNACFQDLSHLALVSKENPENKYLLVKNITKGNSVEIFIVEDNESHDIFALKRVNPYSKRDRDKILTEVAIMQSCTHPNILTCHGCYIHLKSIWIVEELMFLSLFDIIHDKPNSLDEELMAYILKEIIKALVYLNQKHIIHRDVTSANIIISRNGSVKLGDFGYAADLVNGNKRRSTVVGSPCWMAPEMISGSNYDHMVDIWSLGIVALEMAEGSPSNLNENPIKILFKIVTRPPPQLQNPGKYSEEFVNFLDKCLQKRPSDRLEGGKLLEHPFMQKIGLNCQEKLANFLRDWIDN